MFSKFMEKQLLLSMRLDNSKFRILRFMGKLTGILPVWYSRQIEKKYYDDKDE